MNTLPIELIDIIINDAYRYVNSWYVTGLLVCKQWYEILSKREKYIDFGYFYACYTKYRTEMFIHRVKCENRHIECIRRYLSTLTDSIYTLIEYTSHSSDVMSFGITRRSDRLRILINKSTYAHTFARIEAKGTNILRCEIKNELGAKPVFYAVLKCVEFDNIIADAKRIILGLFNEKLI